MHSRRNRMIVGWVLFIVFLKIWTCLQSRMRPKFTTGIDKYHIIIVSLYNLYHAFSSLSLIMIIIIAGIVLRPEIVLTFLLQGFEQHLYRRWFVLARSTTLPPVDETGRSPPPNWHLRQCLNLRDHRTNLVRFPPDGFTYCLTLFSKCFSSFPHGTCSLSVSCQYLALDGVYHPFWAAISNNPTLGIPYGGLLFT